MTFGLQHQDAHLWDHKPNIQSPVFTLDKMDLMHSLLGKEGVEPDLVLAHSG